MFKKLTNIIEGYFFLTCYKLGLITDPKILSVIGQRKVSCNSCPLRTGNWCDKKKYISVKTNEKEMTPFGFYDWKYKKISGCGCYLGAKWFSELDFTENPCPRKLWKKLNNKNNKTKNGEHSLQDTRTQQRG